MFGRWPIWQSMTWPHDAREEENTASDKSPPKKHRLFLKLYDGGEPVEFEK